VVSEQVEEKIKARRWLGVWVKDEKFWKDVAANTVAGIILAIILYVFAVIMGYIQNPGLWQSIGAFLSSIAVTSVVSIIAALAGLGMAVVTHFVTGQEAQRKRLRAERRQQRENQEEQ
jgi:hypothetical protein